MDVTSVRREVAARAATRPREPALPLVAAAGVRSDLAARVYVPGTARAGVLVFVHGGYFVFGDLDLQDSICRRLALACDLTVVAVDYRLAPEHPYPAAVDDVVDAVRWVRRHHGPVGGVRRGAPLAVHLIGDSAGGAIALLAALRLADTGEGVTSLTMTNPNVDLTLRRHLGPQQPEPAETSGLDVAFLSEAVPLWTRGEVGDLSRLDLRSAPPTIVATAGHDPLRAEGLGLVGALWEAEVEVLACDFPDVGHGFLSASTPHEQAAAADLHDAVRRLVGRSSQGKDL